MILLTGATGTVGSEVVKQLRESGARGVRVLARDPSRTGDARAAGFEVVAGDFEDAASLRAALEGVERALLLTPPTPRTFEQQAAFIEAAREAGVRRVVKLSAIGADAAAPGGFLKWHGQADDLLKSSGLGYTILRPNSFMQNLLGQARAIAEQGVIYQPVGDARAAFIDARDIAAVAARVLTEDVHEGKTYVLTGPESLSYYDVADSLSMAMTERGHVAAITSEESTAKLADEFKKVTYVPITPDEFRQGALAQGMPEWLVEALGLLNAAFAAGEFAAVTDDVRRATGRDATSFEAFARDHADAFRADAGQQSS